MKLKTYNGQEASFYIQCKGLHSGRPMKDPIPNCFAVFSNDKNDYALCYSIWKAKLYEPYIWGSVIPFIRITHARNIINNAMKNSYDVNKLESVMDIDELISIEEKKLAKLKVLQEVIAKRTILEQFKR